MARVKRKKVKPVINRVLPTPEQLEKGEFISAAEARRRVPVIETMHKRGYLNDEQFLRLGYYQDMAILAESSPVRSCLDDTVGGGGNGPSAAVVTGMLETARIERDLGSLRDFTRKIVVDNISVTQWCIETYGGRERYDKDGKFIAMVPVKESLVVPMAMMDLRHAAGRIVR